MTQVALASAMLGAALVAVFTLPVLAIQDLQDSSLKARRSQEAIAAANSAETLVIDLETGLRGYFITRDRRLLAPFTRAQRQLPGRLQRLRSLLADEPGQFARVRLIRQETDAYIHDYGAYLIGFVERNTQVNPAGIVATRGGFNRITKIRGWFDDLIAAEGRLAASRDASVTTLASRATVFATAGAVLALLLVLLFALYIARKMVVPIRLTAEAAGGLAKGDLASRVPVVGRGEVRALGESFNQMAASLERTQGDLGEQNRRLRESEHAKTELVNTVSHELRTPLASILGFADVLLRHSELMDDERRYLELIRGESMRLATLLNDLLDVQRIEQGQIDLVCRRLDLNGLVKTQVALYSAQSERHAVTAEVPAEPTLVFADPGRLAQVIGNLLSNAIKYSPDGGPVKVEVTQRDGSGQIAVSDRGLGIRPEFQGRIFTKFFRADVAKLGIGGTGLGLALARQIVVAHGGRIGFRSGEDGGSTFWIALPVIAGPAGDHSASAAAGDELDPGNGGERGAVRPDAASARRAPEADARDVGDGA